MSSAHVVHDPQVLRAISHPVRNRILAELSAQGPLRAADVARELDVPANQASFHLRQLAKYGLVEEDPDAGRDRRDRVWRLTHDHGLTIQLEAMEATPDGSAAAGVFKRNAASWGHRVVDEAYFGPRDDGVHRSLTETALRLTSEEARTLAAELSAVVDAWADRTRGTAAERRTYLYLGVLLPHPGDRTQADDGDDGDDD